MTEHTKPAHVTDDMLTYLDGLRASGKINMFGAAPHVEQTFKLTIQQARQVTAYWMKTFKQRSALHADVGS